jgi:hypothetical protein
MPAKRNGKLKRSKAAMKEVVAQLKGASKMHALQAKRIEQLMKSLGGNTSARKKRKSKAKKR